MATKSITITVTLPVAEPYSDNECVIVGTKALGEAIEDALKKLYPDMEVTESPDFDDEREVEDDCIGCNGLEYLLDKKGRRLHEG